MLRLALDGSTDSLLIKTRGKSEFICTDARRWVDVVVGVYEKFFSGCFYFSVK